LESFGGPALALTYVGVYIVGLCILASVISLASRFRRAASVERQQIKWLLLAVSEKCFRSIAWSNVFKVGALKAKRGNPDKKLISIQTEENTLEEEINMLQPDVAIVNVSKVVGWFLCSLEGVHREVASEHPLLDAP
jgi:hypothetical protein